jgi:hypothetical protein
LRTLAISDLHGRLERAAQFSKLASADFHCLVLCGDITHLGPTDLGRKIVETLTKSGIPVLYVAGNMDPPTILEALQGVGVNLHGEPATVGGFTFLGAGFEYAIGENLKRGFGKLEGRKLDVLVTHAPPYGTEVDTIWGGRHIGSPEVRSFIQEHRPSIALCGHVHEARGLDRLGETLICNPGPAAQGFYAEIQLGGRVEAELLRLKG